jgi:putative pyruvate formate lyase activating enzyme
MWHQVGALTLDRFGIAARGLIVRHLVLPSTGTATQACLSFIAKELSSTVHVSLLTQYEPVYRAADHQQLGRRITSSEYWRALLSLKEMGLWLGWKQRLCPPADELLGIAMKPNESVGIDAA